MGEFCELSRNRQKLNRIALRLPALHCLKYRQCDASCPPTSETRLVSASHAVTRHPHSQMSKHDVAAALFESCPLDTDGSDCAFRLGPDCSQRRRPVKKACMSRDPGPRTPQRDAERYACRTSRTPRARRPATPGKYATSSISTPPTLPAVNAATISITAVCEAPNRAQDSGFESPGPGDGGQIRQHSSRASSSQARAACDR
jgi:hypothetical protein